MAPDLITTDMGSNRLNMIFDRLSTNQYNQLTAFASKHKQMTVQAGQVSSNQEPSYTNVTLNYVVDVGMVKRTAIASEITDLILSSSIDEAKVLIGEREEQSI
jgi:hypothetical protein